MQLVGGNIISGPLSLTLTIHGFYLSGMRVNAPRRSGTKLDDLICIIGTLGNGSAELAILKNKLIVDDTKDKLYLIKHHLRPTPRLMHEKALLEYASSAIDLADGLILNLEHILEASNCTYRS